MNTKLIVPLAIPVGALIPFAFAPFGVFPLAILLPVGLFLLLDCAANKGHGFRIGFAFGFAGFLGGLYWLYISLHTFGNAPLYLAIPLMLGTVAIMASYSGFFGWIYTRWLSSHGEFVRYVVFAPAVWVLLDWMRGWVATGFPWLSLGYSQTDSVLSGFAPVIGVFGITYLVMMLAGCVAYLIRRPKSPLVGTLIVLIMAVGAFLRPVSFTRPVGDLIDVSIVQASIPQDRKWKKEQFVPTLNLYRDLTLANLDSDLIIWPEAAIPAFYDQVLDFLSLMSNDINATEASLLLGIPRHENGRFYNSMVALGGEEAAFYDKRHLVPFGEYFPVPKFVREWMRLRNLPYSDYQSGSSKQKPLEIAGQHIAVTICYEDVFGEEQLERAQDVTLLVNVSNDAWFGDSIAPHQHLQISRMRAMEVRRFLLRATNTGISAIVSPDGVIANTVPQFKTAVLRGEVQGRQGVTPYAYWGNGFIVVFALAVISMAGGLLRRRNLR